MSHIFISYSHEDRKYVEKLEQKLIEEGFNVWIDHHIDYGSQWTEAIENAIDTCGAYIVVMSEHAKQSPWVRRERIHAEKREKPFFPLLLKGEAWFSLGDIQYVDVTGGILPDEKLYQRLEKVIPRDNNAKNVQLEVIEKDQENKEETFHPEKKWQELVRWKKPVPIVVGILIFFAILLTSAYFFLPTIPSTPPFTRSSELTDLFISSDSNLKFDKTVFSKDDEIYLSLYLTENQAVENYVSQWYYLITLFGKDKKILISIQRDNKPTVSNSIIYGLEPPLFPGYYRVDVFKKGDLIGLKYFWVK